ncbi:MAG: hypothetical protein RLZZ546_2813 [Bacteroidota bacterium]|jgi:aspartyl-tRNA(Asn)/glutamyl-tRNA(Gln) amidotransferase subunit C
MKVDKELILKLENLAKLKLSDDERDELKSELEKIIDMFSQIAEVNTEGIEPLIHMSDAVNVLRNDEVGKHLSVNDLKQIAPLVLQDMVAVPKVIE